jgi:hypothetical protein
MSEISYGHGWDGDYECSELVATQLPAGWRLFSAPGQTDAKTGLGDGPDSFEKWCRKYNDCPEIIRIVSAESVGLEWRFGGVKAEWGDKYRKTQICCITPTKDWLNQEKILESVIQQLKQLARFSVSDLLMAPDSICETQATERAIVLLDAVIMLSELP